MNIQFMKDFGKEALVKSIKSFLTSMVDLWYALDSTFNQNLFLFFSQTIFFLAKQIKIWTSQTKKKIFKKLKKASMTNGNFQN